MPLTQTYSMFATAENQWEITRDPLEGGLALSSLASGQLALPVNHSCILTISVVGVERNLSQRDRGSGNDLITQPSNGRRRTPPIG